MEKYIADKKVAAVVGPLEIKTPSLQEMVEVQFEDGSKEIMPQRRYETISTTEISDASTVQATLEKRVAASLFGMLHEYGVKLGEVEEILNEVSNFTNSGYEKARDIKWGVAHKFLSLIDVNNVLIEHAKREKNTNGSASDGGGTDSENKE